MDIGRRIGQVFRENRPTQGFGQESKQQIQVFDQGVPAQAQSVGAAAKASAGSHRFQGIVKAVEGVAGGAAHKSGRGKIGQAKLFFWIEQAACLQVTVDHHGGAVEVGTSQDDNAVGQHDPGDIFGARKRLKETIIGMDRGHQEASSTSPRRF